MASTARVFSKQDIFDNLAMTWMIVDKAENEVPKQGICSGRLVRLLLTDPIARRKPFSSLYQRLRSPGACGVLTLGCSGSTIIIAIHIRFSLKLFGDEHFGFSTPPFPQPNTVIYFRPHNHAWYEQVKVLKRSSFRVRDVKLLQWDSTSVQTLPLVAISIKSCATAFATIGSEHIGNRSASAGSLMRTNEYMGGIDGLSPLKITRIYLVIHQLASMALLPLLNVHDEKLVSTLSLVALSSMMALTESKERSRGVGRLTTPVEIFSPILHFLTKVNKVLSISSYGSFPTRWGMPLAIDVSPTSKANPSSPTRSIKQASQQTSPATVHQAILIETHPRSTQTPQAILGLVNMPVTPS
ncbi:uncharacterized protein CLUP02_09946 [Colletotrichum lupini]|uniref:Uncharacterized protein n=1 Tax=Colletotrichum lupini TaxID=145971 RepID=A0A9Q8SVP2_9PEZI|nr:uncharacterized protein CLUP02_09946 [Colletotrichum lupini]UQC84449.1 hypothetical protein CLUP02_09946 [Colletotrichum lupini]